MPVTTPGPRRLPPSPLPRPPRLSRRARQRWTLTALFLVYLGVLALVVLWPSTVGGNSVGTLGTILAELQGLGVPGWIDYGFVETIANVVMFVPFGMLSAAWLTRERIWLAVVFGMAASCTIEAAQAMLLPQRFATIDDVTANSLGAALGCLAVYAWRTRGSVPATRPR